MVAAVSGGDTYDAVHFLIEELGVEMGKYCDLLKEKRLAWRLKRIPLKRWAKLLGEKQ